jgi:outer membrane protein assembly factor BamB
MNTAATGLKALVIVFLSQTAFGHDWPQWRGPNRNGISSETIAVHWPDGGPPVLWSAAVGTGFAGVSIAGGRAFTLGNSTNQDTVWCLDATTGTPIWKHSYPSILSPQWYEGGPGATPTIDGSRVYTISKWGDIFCFDAKTGAIVWQRDLRQDGIKPNRWGFAGSPLVWRDLVIFNAGGAGTALDRKTGRVVWSNGTNATGYASPTLFGGGGRPSVLIFAAQHLVALDTGTGLERWRFPWKTDWDTNNSDPVRYEDCLFLSSFSHGCSLLSLKSGRPDPLYDSKAVFNNLSPGVLLGRFYYVFSGEAKKDTDFRCLDLPTGQLEWTAKDPAFGSVLGVKGRLLVLTEKGELLIFAPEKKANGKNRADLMSPEPIARARVSSGTCWTPPSLADGRLYVRNAKGEVRCLDLRHQP